MEMLQSQEAAVRSEDRRPILPRSSPLVGFLRHAPPLLPKTSARPTQAIYDNFDQLLQWRSHHDSGGACDNFDSGAPVMKQQTLDQKSPYVGSRRHAPPSPALHFNQKLFASFELPPSLLHLEDFSLSAVSEVPLGLDSMPEEAALVILSFVAEVKGIAAISRVARGFPSLVQSELVWAGCVVHLLPSMIDGLAPMLGEWLPAWRLARKLVIPRSQQLIDEVSRHVPELPVEVAWRFDKTLKGQGVEVIHHGHSVKRVADAMEELVVLGDAALPLVVPHNPYFEVIFDDRSAALTEDVVNDFGIGVTSSPPESRDDIGSVAGEVPLSWVVDFTLSSVVLSVNNSECAKGFGVNAKHLHEGARVGLRVTAAGNLEIFINGELRESLSPDDPELRVPAGVPLFPVLDLYGCTAQLSRTYAEKPY